MVEKIAHLARLRLTEEEKEYFDKQLKSILHFVEQLQEVDTSKVEAFTSPFEETPMREDEPVKAFEPQLVLQKAPKAEGSFFVVPRVVEY